MFNFHRFPGETRKKESLLSGQNRSEPSPRPVRKDEAKLKGADRISWSGVDRLSQLPPELTADIEARLPYAAVAAIKLSSKDNLNKFDIHGDMEFIGYAQKANTLPKVRYLLSLILISRQDGREQRISHHNLPELSRLKRVLILSSHAFKVKPEREMLQARKAIADVAFHSEERQHVGSRYIDRDELKWILSRKRKASEVYLAAGRFLLERGVLLQDSLKALGRDPVLPKWARRTAWHKRHEQTWREGSLKMQATEVQVIPAVQAKMPVLSALKLFQIMPPPNHPPDPPYAYYHELERQCYDKCLHRAERERIQKFGPEALIKTGSVDLAIVELEINSSAIPEARTLLEEQLASLPQPPIAPDNGNGGKAVED
jgi:hypothetical protein